MKKIINQIARYILGIWVMVFVFLLACIFGDNRVDNNILMLAFILCFVVTILLFLVYIIHLIWMIQEKRKPQNLKTDIVSAIFLAIILISYNHYSNQFDWKDILVKMVFIALVLVFGEITRYIYSWKE
jgi:Na+/H+-dicarboxylate symporter